MYKVSTVSKCHELEWGLSSRKTVQKKPDRGGRWNKGWEMCLKTPEQQDTNEWVSHVRKCSLKEDDPEQELTVRLQTKENPSQTEVCQEQPGKRLCLLEGHSLVMCDKTRGLRSQRCCWSLKKEGRDVQAKEHRLHSETRWWEHRFSASGTGNLVKVEGAKMKEGFVKTLKKMSSSQRQNWVWVYIVFQHNRDLKHTLLLVTK